MRKNYNTELCYKPHTIQRQHEWKLVVGAVAILGLQLSVAAVLFFL